MDQVVEASRRCGQAQPRQSRKALLSWRSLRPSLLSSRQLEQRRVAGPVLQRCETPPLSGLHPAAADEQTSGQPLLEARKPRSIKDSNMIASRAQTDPSPTLLVHEDQAFRADATVDPMTQTAGRNRTLGPPAPQLSTCHPTKPDALQNWIEPKPRKPAAAPPRNARRAENGAQLAGSLAAWSLARRALQWGVCLGGVRMMAFFCLLCAPGLCWHARHTCSGSLDPARSARTNETETPETNSTERAGDAAKIARARA